MNKSLLLAGVAAIALTGFSLPALATPINLGPPSGNVIYSLTGAAISSSYTQATATFTANSTNTNLTFAFREDPAFLRLTNVSMVDTTTSSGNLLTNGDFSSGPFNVSAPTGWQYLNQYGASYGGLVETGYSYCGAASSCYFDGAVQAYDAINQVVGTNVGDTYSVTFSYSDTGSAGTYQPLSTNGNTTGTGGNGRDMFVYAANTIPTAVPEPASFALLGTALAFLGLVLSGFGRSRRQDTV